MFELNGDGTSETVLHAFEGGTDGAQPVAGLVAMNGTPLRHHALRRESARLCFNGCGTIFALSPSGQERIVYRFKGGADGALPAARLTAIRGTLYGTTEYGGRTTARCFDPVCGTVFEVSGGR